VRGQDLAQASQLVYPHPHLNKQFLKIHSVFGVNQAAKDADLMEYVVQGGMAKKRSQVDNK
jgi:hypothetical protein